MMACMLFYLILVKIYIKKLRRNKDKIHGIPF